MARFSTGNVGQDCILRADCIGPSVRRPVSSKRPIANWPQLEKLPHSTPVLAYSLQINPKLLALLIQVTSLEP